MKKKLMALAAIFAVFGMASCVSETETVETDTDAVENARKQLGIDIDPNQDWKMVGSKTVAVDAGNGSYTIKVYHGNPMAPNAYLLARKENVSGKSTITFNYPLADEVVYVMREDALHNRSAQPLKLTDNEVSWTQHPGVQTRAYGDSGTEVVAPTITNDMFKTEVPAGTPRLTGWDGSSNVYFIDETSGNSGQKLQPSQVSEIYVVGKVETKNGMYLPTQWGGPASKVYVLPGAELILDAATASDWQNNVTVYVAAGGKISTAGSLKMNNGSMLISKGEIEAGDLVEANGSGYIYSEGTLTADRVYVTNSCKLYNLGSIETGELKVDAAGQMLNQGEVKADKAQLTNAWNNKLENRGRFETDYFDWDNAPIYNNCTMIIGELKQSASSSTLYNREGSYFHVTGTKTTNLKNITFDLAGNSAVEFNGGLYMEWNVTVKGTGEDMSIFAAQDFDYGAGSGTAGGGRFEGNVYIAAKSHLKQDTHNGWTTWWYVVPNTGVEMCDRSNFTITEKQNDCGANINGGNGGNGGDDKPQVYTIAFEDSYHGDYDMNDVVLKVCDNADDDTKLDITLCAVGASYNLYIYLGNAKLFGTEAHSAIGGTPGKFINTGGGSDKFETRTPVTLTINKPEGFDIATADFWIDSPERAIHIATEGQDPHGILIPGDWQWPSEWTRITDAYPSFATFASDVTNAEGTAWYRTDATAGKTYSNE